MKRRLVSTMFAVLAGVGLAGSLAACNQQVATVDVGACAQFEDLQGEITDIPTVDCSEEHDVQVVGKFDMEDGDFPGNDAVESAAIDGCPPLFEEFIGTSYDSSSLEMNYIGPSEDTWNQAKDREVICFAISSEPTTESWEDSGL